MTETHLQEAPEPSSAPSRRLSPGKIGLWAAVAVPGLLHLILAIRNVNAGFHQTVPPFRELEMDLVDWVYAYLHLFAKPETTAVSLRMFALWALVLLGLSIYGAVRSGDGLPSGVAAFVGYMLAALVILAVVTPAAWFLFGDWGPLAAELAPPLTLTLVAVLLAAGASNPA